MKVSVDKDTPFTSPSALLEGVPDDQRRNLLYGFIHDFMGSEDLYLAALDRAEAGTPELNWANNFVNAKMYPDGRVVIEQLEYLLEDSQKDHPPQTVITIAEARKLILDWIEARDAWYAERETNAPQAAPPDAPTAGPRSRG